jgi:hypothetical protein
MKSSCADLIRASPYLFRAPEGVDGPVEPGQDEFVALDREQFPAAGHVFR